MACGAQIVLRGSRQREDMPTRVDRPKLTLERKSPAALPEGVEPRAVKRVPSVTGRIEEIE
jgi:hypothetical protein